MKLPYGKKSRIPDPEAEGPRPRAATTKIRIKAGIASGLSDDDIADSVGVDVSEVMEERERIYLDELERYAESHQKSFVNYSIFVSSKIEQLDSLIESFYDSEGVIKPAAANAAVSAVKAQAEMYDRVLAKASEYKLLSVTEEGEEGFEGLSGSELIAKLREKRNSLDALLGEADGGEMIVKPPPGVKKDSYLIKKRAAKPLPRSGEEGK